MINYSIIIPHYNIPDLLARCLRSIPEREDIQVIVVDDNSPDHNKYLSEIVELQRKNVEFYVTQEGLGAGNARNVGLSHAKGLWLIFADSDDFFVDDFISVVDTHLQDDEDVIYFDIKSCYNNDISKLWSYSRSNLFNKYAETGNEYFFRIACGEPWAKMIKRSLVVNNNIQFQETKANNDFLFSVKTGCLAKTIKVVDVPIYWYVYRIGSLSKQNEAESLEKRESRVLAFYEVQKFLDSIGYKTSYYFPAHPCLEYIHQNFFGYFRLLNFMRKRGIKWLRVIGETIRYWSIYVFKGFRNAEFTKYYGVR